MTIILPVVFCLVFWSGLDFILGDFHWLEHSSSWQGDAGIVERIIIFIIYAFGAVCSFIGGICFDTTP